MRTLGPEFQIVPALTYVSAGQKACAVCGGWVFENQCHAVVVERWDGRVSAGVVAHPECCGNFTEMEETT